MGCCCSKEDASDDDAERTPLLGDKQSRSQHGVHSGSPRKSQDGLTQGANNGGYPPIEDDQLIPRPLKDTVSTNVDFKPIKVERFDQQMEANVSRFQDYLNQFTRLQNTTDELSRMYPDQNTKQTIAGCFSHIRSTVGDSLGEAVMVKDADPTCLWITYKAESVHHSLLPAFNTFNKASRLVKEIMHEGPQLAVAVDDVIFSETDMQDEIVKCTRQAGEFVRNRCLEHCLYDIKQFFRIKEMLEKIEEGTCGLASELQTAASKVSVNPKVVGDVSVINEQVQITSESAAAATEISRNTDKLTVAEAMSPGVDVDNTNEHTSAVVNDSVQQKSDPVASPANIVHIDDTTKETMNVMSDVDPSTGEAKHVGTDQSSHEQIDESTKSGNITAEDIAEIKQLGPDASVTVSDKEHANVQVSLSDVDEHTSINDADDRPHVEGTFDVGNDNGSLQVQDTVDDTNDNGSHQVSETVGDTNENGSHHDLKIVDDTNENGSHRVQETVDDTNENGSHQIQETVDDANTHGNHQVPETVDDEQDPPNVSESQAELAACDEEPVVSSRPTIENKDIDVVSSNVQSDSQTPPLEPLAQEAELTVEISTETETQADTNEISVPDDSTTLEQVIHVQTTTDGDSTTDTIKDVPEPRVVPNGHTNGHTDVVELDDNTMPDAVAKTAVVATGSSNTGDNSLSDEQPDAEQGPQIIEKKPKKRKSKKAKKQKSTD